MLACDEQVGEAMKSRLGKQVRDAKTHVVEERAQEAWDAGRMCFVMKTASFTWALSDAELTDAVESVLRIGWRLAGTALAFNTAGINTCLLYTSDAADE